VLTEFDTSAAPSINFYDSLALTDRSLSKQVFSAMDGRAVASRILSALDHVGLRASAASTSPAPSAT
jgi:hypothetical protein